MYCKNCETQWPVSEENKKEMRDALKIITQILRNANIPINEKNVYPLIFLDMITACCDKPDIYWREAEG